MGWLDHFRSQQPNTNNTAALAKERLQMIIVAPQERSHNGHPDYLHALKKELLEVVRKYVPIEQNKVKVHLDRESGYEILELNIMLPEAEQCASHVNNDQP